ncbi:MAG: hypothetical protein IJ743_00420 [Bacilli bacterium]|nr:hypothetical protein [Bacilli bacterium]
MNAKSVNDLFEQAWAEYYDFKKEVKIFCEENGLNHDLLKVEMTGPHVCIKHGLTPKIWTEELHNMLCDTFGVYLISFSIEKWKSTTRKPAISIFRWNYRPEYHDEKFILEYEECALECVR